jgi:hypothetical protein
VFGLSQPALDDLGISGGAVGERTSSLMSRFTDPWKETLRRLTLKTRKWGCIDGSFVESVSLGLSLARFSFRMATSARYGRCLRVCSTLVCKRHRALRILTVLRRLKYARTRRAFTMKQTRSSPVRRVSDCQFSEGPYRTNPQSQVRLFEPVQWTSVIVGVYDRLGDVLRAAIIYPPLAASSASSSSSYSRGGGAFSA